MNRLLIDRLELRHATFDPSHLVGRELVRFIAATDRIPLWLVISAAAAYTAVRWTEAWGIWTRTCLVLGNICVVILMLTWLRHAPASDPR